ncbi:flagellar basal body rod protein FlgF [Parendozoicomonas haliclonae]|uniref:Flagellar basal-body rod protein FlgF n=1 Tax=Parendozoicomonas haliclonae TaxID=1960125 RepID=A0A1X7AGE1_9GAMM|nr:flagellar basal body rod protein FlgF [Parendozoicomonas haliclonae]SMA39774.1 Flagellar basal-body rod protein FlgF [Parendozoicomonas haliclonae]
MDKSLYVGLSGASRTLQAQLVHANNLANLSTTGFRADFVISDYVETSGDGMPSRVMTVPKGVGSRMSSGAVNHTGRELDIAVAGEGWIAVQDKEGLEAYTRAGDLMVSADGDLVNGAGHPVLGNGGAMNLTAYRKVQVGFDGTVSVLPVGGGGELIEVGQIKLVNPAAGDIYKGEDGLFRRFDGEDADQDGAVQLRPEHLETSNVSAIEEMIGFMNLSRQFEMQLKTMQNTEQMAASGDRVLRDE